MTSPPPASSEVKTFFEENGYYLAKNVFSPSRLPALEEDFDRIVSQLLRSKEDANAQWKGAAMDRLGAADTVVVHTHNVQNYSSRWFAAFQHPGFLNATSEILGPDIILHHSKLFQKPQGKGAPLPMH